MGENIEKIYQNLWDKAKQCVSGNLKLQMSILKKRFCVNSLILHL